MTTLDCETMRLFRRAMAVYGARTGLTALGAPFVGVWLAA